MWLVSDGRVGPGRSRSQGSAQSRPNNYASQGNRRQPPTVRNPKPEGRQLPE